MKKQLDDGFDALLMNNSYAKAQRLELIEQARKRWNESEWVLGMLRSHSAVETKRPDDDELTEWFERLPPAPLR
jgi:hypothetical protein